MRHINHLLLWLTTRNAYVFSSRAGLHFSPGRLGIALPAPKPPSGREALSPAPAFSSYRIFRALDQCQLNVLRMFEKSSVQTSSGSGVVRQGRHRGSLVTPLPRSSLLRAMTA